MLAPGQLRDELQALLEGKVAETIEEWLATAEVPPAVKEVLRRGLRGEETYDAVEVACLMWYDRCGTRTSCVARRIGSQLHYEVWQDGAVIGKYNSDAELTGPELCNLMVTGDRDDDDYTGQVTFVASSAFHDDLEDYQEGEGEGKAELDPCREIASGDIEASELPGHEFGPSDLTGLRASRANLEAAGFCHAQLVGADLFAAQLRHADLRFAELRYACLQSADLEGAQLQGADLRNANLRFASLRNAKLCGADLRHADTRWADMSGADLTNCHW